MDGQELQVERRPSVYGAPPAHMNAQLYQHPSGAMGRIQPAHSRCPLQVASAPQPASAMLLNEHALMRQVRDY